MGSVDTENVKVSYILRCFTKINSMFEVGQGTAVDFPLMVVQKPFEALREPLDPTFKVYGEATFHEFNQDEWSFKEDN